jgi:hypothetical protein
MNFVQKVSFVHGVATWLRNLEGETTFDANVRVSAHSKTSGSDYNRITVEFASVQASVVMFISTCGDVFKKMLPKQQEAEFESVSLVNLSTDEGYFPMFRFSSNHFPISGKISSTSTVSVVAFAGSIDGCLGTRLIDECFLACRHSLQYILTHAKFQPVTGGFHALQSFCNTFVRDHCAEHRVTPCTVEKTAFHMHSRVQIPLSETFYYLPLATFSGIVAGWSSAKTKCRSYLLDSKLSLDSMPHPVSLDELFKTLREQAVPGFFGKKTSNGTMLNVLAENSNKQRQIIQIQDAQNASHTIIRRKSTVTNSNSLHVATPMFSASKHKGQKTIAKGRGGINEMLNIDSKDLSQSSGNIFHKLFITAQAKFSAELTKALTSKNAPKARVLKEEKCMLTDCGLERVPEHREISSIVVACSQKFIVLTIGTYLQCVEIEMNRTFQIKSKFEQDMTCNLQILNICEDSNSIFLLLSDGRLICLRILDKKSGVEYRCTEFQTHIENCSMCSLIVHHEWINICGSEGSSSVDFVRFKLESSNVVENSGHVVPLHLSASVTAVHFHICNPKVLCPFIFCGLCTSEIEIWGNSSEQDFHLMQCLRNRTSGLGAVNSFCSMGQNNIAVGHEGGYVHFWLLDFSISSSSSLDRQFGLSQSSEGFPTSFQSISADKFAGDQHVMNSQLFVINEQYGDSFIMHAETGVLLHKFSRPSVPPHILHHFSGQFNEFITFFELSILHIQGSCLHHLVFQLQYVSSDQGSKSFDLAVSTLRQRRNSQHQVVSDVKQVQRTIPSDPTEHPLIDFTGIRNGYGGNAFDYSKHHESIRDVSNEHNKSSARLFSSHSNFTPPTNLLTSDGDDNLSEKQNISTSSKLLTSMRPKASGIMDQILSRRSNPSNRAEIICTEPSHVVDFTDDNISADCAVGQTVILPLTPLPTKFDSQRLSDNREASEGMKYFHDQFRSSTRALRIRKKRYLHDCIILFMIASHRVKMFLMYLSRKIQLALIICPFCPTFMEKSKMRHLK